jgi:hypothetical protein
VVLPKNNRNTHNSHTVLCDKTLEQKNEIEGKDIVDKDILVSITICLASCCFVVQYKTNSVGARNRSSTQVPQRKIDC